MTQIKIKTIDPAVLAKIDAPNEEENTLNLGEITEGEKRAAE